MGVLIETKSGIKGSVPGLLRMVIDDDSGHAQRLVILGLQSRHYSTNATAALLYECESRTALGGSATAAGPSGASGSGSNVMRQTDLFTAPQAIMSTQASGGGAHLSHVGSFRWWQRLYVPFSNSGSVTVALEWGEGDFQRTTQNASVEIPSTAHGSWVLVDLGTVQLTKVAQGTQRWEGRVMASSTVVGDDIDLDRFLLVPFDEGYCEMPAPYSYRPGVLVARDAFTGKTAGSNLGGTAAPLGGSWATSGVTTDFQFADGPGSEESVSRATVADAGFRYAVLGSTSFTDMETGAGIYLAGTSYPVLGGGLPILGVIARWVDANNLLQFYYYSGSVRLIATVAGSTVASDSMGYVLEGSTHYALRLVVWASGHAIGTLLDDSGATLATCELQHSSLATGGALDDGKPGILDLEGSATASTRYYDDIYVATPPAEPLSIAPSRSLEIRSDGASRQDAGGTLWMDVPIEGFYPRVPPAWLEGRSTRFVVATSRGPKLGRSVWADPADDALSMAMWYTPRSLNLPEA